MAPVRVRVRVRVRAKVRTCHREYGRSKCSHGEHSNSSKCRRLERALLRTGPRRVGPPREVADGDAPCNQLPREHLP